MHGLRARSTIFSQANQRGSPIEMGEKTDRCARPTVSRPGVCDCHPAFAARGTSRAKAFDGDTGTYWERNVGNLCMEQKHLVRKFPEPVCVKAVRRYCASGPLGRAMRVSSVLMLLTMSQQAPGEIWITWTAFMAKGGVSKM